MPTAYSKALRVEATIPEGMSNEDFDNNMVAAQEKIGNLAEWSRDRLENRLQNDPELRQYNMTVTLGDS
jgi:hypothetical protein